MFDSCNAAQRRYLLRILVATISYLVTLFVAVKFVSHGVVTGVPAYALALLPGLSVVGFFWAVARLIIEETDEYKRMLLVRQTLIATGFTLSVATIWGFLEDFQLAPHVDAFYLAMLWFVGFGVGRTINRLTTGDAGPCT